MEYFKLCDKARDLAFELMQDPIFQKLSTCKKTIDKEYQAEIQAFKKWEIKFNEVKEYGKYHPDYYKVRDEFARAKDQLFALEIVKEYKKLEHDFQKKLNEVCEIIKESIR